jgi:hypothetical protein
MKLITDGADKEPRQRCYDVYRPLVTVTGMVVTASAAEACWHGRGSLCVLGNVTLNACRSIVVHVNVKRLL